MDQATKRSAADHPSGNVCLFPDLLEMVFENAAEGLLVTNSQGHVLRANAAILRILNLSEHDVLQTHLYSFIPPDPPSPSTATPPTLCPFEQRVTPWRHDNGTELYLESTCTVLHDRSNAIIGAVCSVRDITSRVRAEAALIETRDFLDSIFESSIDCIVLKDAKGHITRASRSFLDLVGCEEHEVLGKSMENFTPRAGLTYDCTTGSPVTIRQHELVSVAEKIFFLNKQKVITNLNTYCLQKNGFVVPVEENLFALFDSQQKLIGSVAILRNSTERQRAGDALRESEERFRALSQSVPEAVVAADVSGRIIFWNAGAEKTFGYTDREICGKPVSVLIPERLRDEDAAFLADIEESFPAGSHKRFTGIGLRKDGSEFSDEVSLGVWQTHDARYFVAIIRDITERKQAEDALHTSKRRFEELADSLPQTVFEIDTSARLTFVNRMALEMFGYTLPEIQAGLSVLSLFVPELRLQIRENLRRVGAGERFGEHECTALRKDGSTFPCIVHATANSGGSGVRGLLIDISEHKHLEEELVKARRLESVAALAGGVAQDFSSILSVILGNINLAQHHAPPLKVLADPLNCAEKSALRAKDLTDQLLLFARRGDMIKKPLCIVSILQQAIARALPPGSNVTCSFIPPEKTYQIAADETQMVQVFVNLLINAEHAMPEGGTIKIALLPLAVGPGDNLPLHSGTYLKISICDQSIGILNEHIQNIFDPYFLSRQRGSGIGLATTYSIVKNHGGLVVVESEFGQGTTFYIYLPAARD